MEFSKRFYVGGRKFGKKRLNNIKELANRYFKGNVSALINDALNRVYGLDPDSGDPLSGQTEVFMVADKQSSHPYSGRTGGASVKNTQ